MIKPLRLHTLVWIIILITTGLILTFSYRSAQNLTRTAVDSANQVASDIAFFSQQKALLTTRAQLNLNASAKVALIQAKLNEAMSVATTLANVLTGMKSEGLAAGMGRDSVNSMLQTTLYRHADILAIYTVWEPDAFDMLDLAYADTSLHDNTGRFAPYWYRSISGELTLTTASHYASAEQEINGTKKGAYYLQPKKTLEPQIIDPIRKQLGEKLRWVISLSVPITTDKLFYGVVGVDIPLDLLQFLTIEGTADLFSGQSKITLISHNNTIVASSNPLELGKLAPQRSYVGVRTPHSAHGLALSVNANKNIEIRSLVRVNNTFTPWSIQIFVPESYVYAEPQKVKKELLYMAHQIENELKNETKLALWTQLIVACVLAVFTLVIVRLIKNIELRKSQIYASEQRLQAILDDTDAVIYLKDLNGEHLLINRAFEKLFNLTKQQIIGKSDFDLLPVEVAKELRRSDTNVQNSRSSIQVEETIPINGVIHTYISLKFLIYDDKHIPYAVCGISTNITKRKRFEGEIIKLNSELESLVEERNRELKESNKSLNQSLNTLKKTQEHLIQSEKQAALGNLVAGVAHEINTPLGTSITATSHLQDSTKEIVKELENNQVSRHKLNNYFTSVDDLADILLVNLQREADLINNFKQLAADQSSYEKRQFNLKAYLNNILTSMAPGLKHKNHKIDVICSESLSLYSYPGALAPIVTNLVNNAITHGFEKKERGLIWIEVETTENRVIISFYDDGCGMPENISSSVFEPFTTRKRGQGGRGLGMHLVYNLVTTTLNGTIECFSQLGKGTKFVISLPIAKIDRLE